MHRHIKQIVKKLLFGIFINDLPLSTVHSTPFLYADGTKCLNIINSLNDIDNLQTDLLLELEMEVILQ